MAFNTAQWYDLHRPAITKLNFLFYAIIYPTGAPPIYLNPILEMSRPNLRSKTDAVNFYGYWEQVVTGVEFDDVTVKVYDTTDGQMTKAVKQLWDLHSWDFEGSALASHKELYTKGLEYPSVKQRDTPNDIISSVEVYHVYVDGGIKKDTYKFLNPKIRQINFSDLSMSSGDAATIDLTFSCSAVDVVLKEGESEGWGLGNGGAGSPGTGGDISVETVPIMPMDPLDPIEPIQPQFTFPSFPPGG